jgi:histidine triad (HIT) family protein
VACIFCEIVAGRSPASVVHDDEHVLAFLTVHQTRPGELVVIPKTHIDHFSDLDDALSAHLCVVAQQISRRMRERLQPLRVGWIVHGFGVAHAHLIVVPQHHADDIASARHAVVENGVVRFTEAIVPPTPREELDRLAALLRA